MKKLLILGTSIASTEIVQKARKRGWYTIVTDSVWTSWIRSSSK